MSIFNSKKAFFVYSCIFFYLFSLISVSWATKHAVDGGKRFSTPVRGLLMSIAGFPGQAKAVIGLLENRMPPKGNPYVYKNCNENSSNSIQLNGYILIPYVGSNGLNKILICNLSNRVQNTLNLPPLNTGLKQYSDVLKGADPKRQEAVSSRNRMWNPYLFENGRLIFNIPWNDLISVNLKTGEEEWRICGSFHHSIEADVDGNLWVCGSALPGSIISTKTEIKHSNDVFEDSILVNVSTRGKINKTISVADLLLKSGLEYILYGASNPNLNSDPIHLNQITPIHNNSGVFKRGQILVSLRNISTILLVDPEKETVLWHRSGPWINQHSVFPVESSTISVLDNHSFASGEYWLNPAWKTRIIKYRLDVGQLFEVLSGNQIVSGLRIPVEGRVIPIGPEAWLIEDSHQGTVMVIKDNQLIFKWSNLYPNGNVGITSWCRYYPDVGVIDGLLKQMNVF